MLRALVFDFNGVLIDDERVHFDLLREVLAEEGIGLTEGEYYDEYLGYDDRGSFEVALAAAGQPAGRERIEELIARKAQRYRDRAGQGLRIFPGAAQCVQALAQRWPVAICSGALRAEIELALELLGVRTQVAAIVAAEDTTRCKPDPEGYMLAFQALRALRGAGLAHIEPADCLAVEDSLAGVASARDAGMRTLAVTHTYTAQQLRAAGAQWVLESLEGLTPEWIDRNFPAEPGGPERKGHG